MPPPPAQVTVGVDTHLEVHVAYAADQLGRGLDTISIPTTPGGYQDLLAWAQRLGEVRVWGIEGTGCYGAALTRFLHARGQLVVEVNRPDRQARRRRGKSDPVDAAAAARAVQAGQATTIPKGGGAGVEMLRCLRVVRATAVKARTQALNALKALLVTAPVELRERLRGLPAAQLVAAAAGLAPGALATPAAAVSLAVRTLAERYQALSGEIRALSRELDRLTASLAPALLARFGIGADYAGQLLVTAGDSSERLRSEAAFAMLCGVAPLPASSGKSQRYRLM
jgi:transposase